MKILIAGWFSFREGHATAGDILARNLVCEWLESNGLAYDIAVAPPFSRGVDWCFIDPKCYSHVLFVCGPFEKKQLELEFLQRFIHCRIIGLNLSMFEPLDRWNPFDFLIERDSSKNVNADIVFFSRQALVPVVGICLVEHYENALVYEANTSIQRLVSSREMAVVNIDTRLDRNCTNLRSPSEVESLIARMDVIITTRLHGTVLALKNSIPAIPIDPITGGHKVKRQVELVGWPVVFTADALDDHALQKALNYCLTAEARKKAKECSDRAGNMVREIRKRFINALTDSIHIENNYRTRFANIKK